MLAGTAQLLAISGKSRRSHFAPPAMDSLIDLLPHPFDNEFQLHALGGRAKLVLHAPITWTDGRLSGIPATITAPWVLTSSNEGNVHLDRLGLTV